VTELLLNFSHAVKCQDNEIDLGRAALVIAQMEYPDLEVEPYLKRMDRLATVIKDLVGDEDSVFRLLACINIVLFKQEGFQGNRSNYYDPKNSFLNDLIDRKMGIPITLSVLYQEVARRAGLTLHGVGFPGHFLLKHIDHEEEIIIDPFNGGEVRSDAELQSLLDEIYPGKAVLKFEFLSPVSKRQILKRMLINLRGIYLHQGDFLRCLSVEERLVILEPNPVREYRDRGLLHLRLKNFPQALEDLETYLRLASDANDADEIREQVSSLKKRVTQLH